MIRFSTPYYVSGRGAQRWHTNHGEKAAYSAAGLGAVSYGLRNPKFAGAAADVLFRKTGYQVSSSEAAAWSKALGYAAGGTAAYSGYHFTRAAKYNKQLKEKKMSKGRHAAQGAKTGTSSQHVRGGKKGPYNAAGSAKKFTGSTYKRRLQSGRTITVRKGRRR